MWPVLAEAFVRYLTPELVVAPGTLGTQAVRDLFGSGTDAFLRQEAAGNPSGRNDDYAGLVKFLASPGSRDDSGTGDFVNGGQYVIS